MLLSRCGDALMLHLLLHASVFAPLPGGCLLQLSGLPAAEVGVSLCGANRFMCILRQRVAIPEGRWLFALTKRALAAAA